MAVGTFFVGFSLTVITSKALELSVSNLVC